VFETLHFHRQGRPPAEIAKLRGVKENTIWGHLAEALAAGEEVNVDALLDARAQQEMAAALQQSGFGNLSGAVESLGGRYLYGQLRVYRAAKQAERKAGTVASSLRSQ
jgi:ATP-dependent DNA helicase RecQ